MAAGLGTRMRSATPKHLHPLLGRRMVDWVLEAARERRRRAARRRRLARDARRRSTGVEVAVQEQPLGTGDAVRCARAALEGRAGDVLVLSGDTPLLTAELLARARRDAPRARTPPRPSSRSSPTTPRATAASSATRDGHVARDRRGGDATRGGARDPRGATRRSTSSAPPRSGRRSTGSSRTNAQGELYLTDAVRAPRRGRRDRRGARRAPTRPRPRASTRAPSSPPRRPSLRDRINERAHARRRRRSSIPPSTWIEPDVELEPDAVDPPVHRPPRRDARRARAPRSARTRSSSTPSSGAGATVGPFCYLRPGTVLEAGCEGGDLRGDQELAHRRRATKVPHLSYIGDADIGEDTNVGAGHDHRQLPAPARPAEGPDDDRQQRQDRRPQCLRRPGRDRRRCMDCGRLGDHRGRAGRRARGRAGAAGEQGRATQRQRGDD